MSFLKKYKKTFSLLIIIGALVISFFIVREEKKPDYLFQVVENGQLGTSTLKNLNTFNLPNLTNELTNQSIQKLIEENEKRGTKTIETAKTIPNKEETQKIIDEIIDNELKSEFVDPQTIQTLKDDSKETQEVYLLVINNIINGVSINTTQETTKSTQISEYFSKTASAFASAEEVLRVMNVPRSWVDIHAKLIGFFAAQKNIYSSLALASQDPLRFMIAIQRIGNESEGRFEAIKTDIKERIKSEGLL
ncbi:MAG: hypothetical protein AB1333_00970 [Patescibacteria group bacterium]